MKHSYLSDFEKSRWIEYCADDVRIVNDFRKVTFSYDYPLTRDFVVVMFCIKGKLSITIDDRDYSVSKGQVLFLQPSSSVTQHSYSADLDRAHYYSLLPCWRTAYCYAASYGTACITC